MSSGIICRSDRPGRRRGGECIIQWELLEKVVGSGEKFKGAIRMNFTVFRNFASPMDIPKQKRRLKMPIRTD